MYTGLYRTFAALAIAWAFILTFNTGCDIESPGDDDDVLADDDDATDDFAATIGGQSEEPGDFTMLNGIEIGACTGETLCTMDVDEPYPYSVGFETENELFVRKATHIEETDNGVENIATFAFDEDKWGKKPNGSYDLYDAACGNGGLLIGTYDIETTEDGTDTTVTIDGIGSFTIEYDTFGDGMCIVSSDTGEIDCDNGYAPNCYYRN